MRERKNRIDNVHFLFWLFQSCKLYNAVQVVGLFSCVVKRFILWYIFLSFSFHFVLLSIVCMSHFYFLVCKLVVLLLGMLRMYWVYQRVMRYAHTSEFHVENKILIKFMNWTTKFPFTTHWRHGEQMVSTFFGNEIYSMWEMREKVIFNEFFNLREKTCHQSRKFSNFLSPHWKIFGNFWVHGQGKELYSWKNSKSPPTPEWCFHHWYFNN